MVQEGRNVEGYVGMFSLRPSVQVDISQYPLDVPSAPCLHIESPCYTKEETKCDSCQNVKRIGTYPSCWRCWQGADAPLG